MFHLFLTQGSGILGPIEIALGWILNAIYEFLNLLNIGNVALTIIIFTFIVKTAMLPLTIKQQKYSKLSSVMNPEIVKIQNKYKGKKDEVSMQKQQAELQAVYEKYGSSPTSGCLPMLITLPIMFALYRVIYKIPAYINIIKDMYTQVAESIQGIEGYAPKLIEYGQQLGVKVSSFEEFQSGGILTLNHTIDILSKFSIKEWTQLATEDFPTIANIINTYSSQILKVNSIPGGLNLLEAPGWAFPGILIPILAASLQFIQTKQMALPQSSENENPAASSMAMMSKVMPIMSGVFCVMLPSGIGLYWVANSGFTIIQQFFINKYMKTVDTNELVEKNVKKRKKKLEKKGIPQGQTLQNLASKQTKSINSNEKPVKTNSQKQDKKSNLSKKNNNNKNVSYGAGSISANANLLKKRYSDKGDK